MRINLPVVLRSHVEVRPAIAASFFARDIGSRNTTSYRFAKTVARLLEHTFWCLGHAFAWHIALQYDWPSQSNRAFQTGTGPDPYPSPAPPRAAEGVSGWRS